MALDLPIVRDSTTYRCHSCPHCKKSNWLQDYWKDSYIALKCWSCGKPSWLDDDSLERAKSQSGIGYTEESYIEDYGDLEGFNEEEQTEEAVLRIAEQGKERP